MSGSLSLLIQNMSNNKLVLSSCSYSSGGDSAPTVRTMGGNTFEIAPKSGLTQFDVEYSAEANLRISYYYLEKFCYNLFDVKKINFSLLIREGGPQIINYECEGVDHFSVNPFSPNSQSIIIGISDLVKPEIS